MTLLQFLGRFLRGVAIALMVVIILLVAAIGYLGYTASGNQFLANQIAAQVSTPDMQIALEGASGLLEGRFHLDRVIIADTNGKFASVENLDLFWTPSELFRLRFHADRIAAAKVAFDRAPVKTVESEQSDSTSSSSFSLPIEVKVDSFDLPVIALGRAIARKDTVLGLNGSVQAVADRIALSMNAVEKDRLNATAKASLTYAVNAKTLAIDATVDEPQGGLLARLLALPGAPPVEVAIKGDGPLDDWKGTVNGRLAGKDVLLLTGSHTLAGSGVHEIQLNGGGPISEFMPVQFRSLFSGQTTVDIDARFADSGLLDIRRGSITNDSFKLLASGALDPKGAADLKADLQPVKETIRLDLPLASGTTTIDLTGASLAFAGEFAAAKVDLQAQLAGLTTNGTVMSNVALTAQSANLNLASKTGALTYGLTVAALTSDNRSIAKLAQAPLSLKGAVDIDADTISLTSTELESPKLGGKINGRLVRSTQVAAADFDLFLLPNELLPAKIASKLNGTIAFSGQMSATLPSTFAVANLKLVSNLATITGGASLDAGVIKANLAGTVAELGDFADKASGNAHFTLAASGPLDKPDVTAEVTSDEVRFADNAVQSLQLKLTGPLDVRAPGGHVSLSTLYQGKPIKADADVTFTNGLLSIPALKADIGSNSISGALALDAAFLPSGTLALDLPDISGLAALAKQNAEGTLKGTVAIATVDGKITGTISANGPRLSSEGVEISNPKVDLQIADVLAQQMTGKMTADSIASGANRLERVDLDIGVAGRQLDFALASQFDTHPLEAKGAALLGDDGLTVKLASFSAAPRQVYVKLGQPTDITVHSGVVGLDKLTIAAGEGTIVVNGTAGTTLNLKAAITDLPLALANAFVKNLDASGRLSANATISGAATAPQVVFDIGTTGLVTSHTKAAKLPELTIAAHGQFIDNRLSVEATSNVRGQPIKASAEIKLLDSIVSIPSFKADIGVTSVAGTLTLDPKSQPSGRISFDIPDADALAAVVGRKAEGALKGTVDIASEQGKLTGKLDATGMVRGQAITALVQATSTNGALALPALKVDIGRNTLSGALALDGEMLPSGALSFDFPDIALLAAMAGQKAEGAIKGTADITTKDGKIDAKIDANGKIRGQAINLNTRVISDRGAISVPMVDATAGPNTVTGAVTLDGQFMPSGKISFDLPDIALLASMAGQKAEGSIKGTADVTSVGKRIDAAVAATGAIRGQTIEVHTNIVSENGLISIPTLKADIGRNTLTGMLTLDTAFLPTGRFSFNLPDIGLIAAIAGQKADGILEGSAEIKAVDGKLTGMVKAKGDTINAASLRIVRPVIDLTFADLAAGQISGQVSANQIASGANHLDQLALKIALANQVTHFDLTSQFDAAPLTAAGQLRQEDGGLTLTLSSFAATPRKIPVVLKQQSDIRIKDGNVSLKDLVINAGKGSIIVNGKAGQRLDLDAKIAALPLSLVNTVSPDLDAGGTISVDIKVSGDAAAPAVAFDAKLQDIATAQTRSAKLPALYITAKGQFADNHLSVTAESKLHDQLTRLAAQVSLTNGRVGIQSFKADIGESIFSGTLALDEKSQPAGRVEFDIPDAKALAAIVGQNAEGAIKGTADITSAGGKVAVKLDANGTIRKQPIKTLADINLENGAVSLPSLKLDVGRNRLAGAVTLDRRFMPSGQVTFDFPDLALLAAMAGQKAEGALKGTADIRSDADRIDAKVVANGLIRKQTVDINVEAMREGGKVRLPTLKLDVGKNTLSGALELSADFMPTGKITFDLPDVGLLAAMAGQQAAGSIRGSADIQSADGKISGAISANGKKLTSNGAEIVNPLLDLKIADLVTGQISGRVSADRIASGANVLANLALDFTRSGDKTGFNLNGRYDAGPLSAKGTISQQPDEIVLALDSFVASPRAIPVKLNKPTEIRIKNGAVSLSSLTISAGKGTIHVSGAAGDQLNLAIKVTALPASLADAVSPGLGASGSISADATVKGSATAPVVAFDTRWQNAALRQTRSAGLADFTVSAKGQLANNVLTVNTTAKGGAGLSMTAAGTVGMAGNRALNIKANGQVPFAALAGLLAAQGVDLKGNARVELAVTGAANSPTISGRITTSGTTLTVIRQNLTVNTIAATVTLDGKQARIASLTGKISGGGTLSVSGTIGIAPNSGYPADIRIALKNAVYTDGKVVAAKLSGDLTLTGPIMTAPKLGGKIALRRADITVPQKLPGTLAQVDIKHIHAPKDVLIQAREIHENRPGKKSGKDTGGMALDLVIVAPRQIFVRGRGLDAELGGKVTIAGTASVPNVTGGFKMLRGRLSIVGKRLDFSEGQISFGGDLTPALDFTATSTVESTTVNVIIAGLVNDPSVSFTSSPALPQDEVLALLIFGRDSAALSPVQIAQLADAVSTLAGGQSNSLFNKLRQGLGVDDLDLGTDENGKSNVSVGKYLNKRTYLQLQQDVDDNTTKATINLDIGKGVKLRGAAGSDGSTSGGVFFEKEY